MKDFLEELKTAQRRQAARAASGAGGAGRKGRGAGEEPVAERATTKASSSSSSSAFWPSFTSSSSSFLFDLAVIDEAAQALEVACYIPMMLARRLVLAGV